MNVLMDDSYNHLHTKNECNKGRAKKKNETEEVKEELYEMKKLPFCK